MIFKTIIKKMRSSPRMKTIIGLKTKIEKKVENNHRIENIDSVYEKGKIHECP